MLFLYGLFLYGLLIPMDGSATFVSANTADNYLHLVLSIGMIGLGVVLGCRATGWRAPADRQGRALRRPTSFWR